MAEMVKSGKPDVAMMTPAKVEKVKEKAAAVIEAANTMRAHAEEKLAVAEGAQAAAAEAAANNPGSEKLQKALEKAGLAKAKAELAVQKADALAEKSKHWADRVVALATSKRPLSAEAQKRLQKIAAAN